MRLTARLPFIALLGLAACDSSKVASLTGAKPATPVACTPNPVAACAPASGVASTAMAREGDKAGARARGEDQVSVKVNDDRFAAPAAPTASTRVHRAYRAAAHGYQQTRHAVRRVHTVRARKVIVVRKNYYIHDTRYVTVERPIYQPPQVVYAQPPRPPVYVQPQRPAIYVDREIDRTSSAYGHQVYNRYAHAAGPLVVYQGVYRQDQQGYSGGDYDCNCASMPAAGRDRSGYLTWPGKTESRTY